MKIRKAEGNEKKNYQGMYPLFGYVRVPAIFAKHKTSFDVPVEYLGEGKGEPNFEAILPNGLHLEGEEIHTVLGTTQRELVERLSVGLVECNEYCHDLNSSREIA